MKPSDFVESVVSAYEKGTGVFVRKVNAEDLLPEESNDQQKALFLFYVVQLDYATKSQNLYRLAKQLFKTTPDFFKPEKIVKLRLSELNKKLVYLRPRYINEATKRYSLNSKFLLEKYHGQPKLIFETSKSIKDVLLKIREFRGFGPKIGNFFIRTMINTFGYKYDDIDNLLPPVDVHDVRIAFLMGYIKSKDMFAGNIKKTKILWSEACKKAKKSWLIFDKALWLLGSEGKPKTKEDIFESLRRKEV